MALEARPATSIQVEVMESRLMRENEALLLPDTLMDRSPEKVDAADAVFSEKEKESEIAAGLVSLWAGSLLLHDVVADHLREPEEVEVELKKKPEEDKENE